MREVAERLAVLTGTPVVPGETLLFIDEIQFSQEAIRALRYFKEDYPELHVVAAGSLLEFALADLASFGVGRVTSVFMYPLSFKEFLHALKKTHGSMPSKKPDAPHPFSMLSTIALRRLSVHICS